MSQHKAGYVNIIGKPNAGKSTLCNALVGEQLSIITPKASTTRHRILGIVNTDEYQVVFSDTPGIIEPAYKLHESMMSAVRDSIDDADVLIVLVDVTNYELNEEHLKLIAASKSPVILMVNKVDLSEPSKVASVIRELSEKIQPKEVFAISAINGVNADSLLKTIVNYLP